MKAIEKIKITLSKSKIALKIYHLLLFLRGKGHFVFVTQEFFTGWGMTTGTRTPWMNGGGHKITKDFYNVDLELKELVKKGYFSLSQFSSVNQIKALNGLMWRHYIVYWSSVFAIKNTNSEENNFVECGVCDGLTSFYALSAAVHTKTPFNAYLYDAWQGMEEDRLVSSEKQLVGTYSYLDMNSTIKNLSLFNSDNLIFNRGYIPDVFQQANNPDSLIWLHIDLNSSVPTVHVLNQFWDCLEVGGIILLDDYAWPAHDATQTAVEEWQVDKTATLLHLPTGQALLIKGGKTK